MTPGLNELLDALEAAWRDPASATLEELGAMLEERSVLLMQLDGYDRTALSTAARTHVAKRLQAIRERDALLQAALTERLQAVQQALDMTLKARDTVRGYRSLPPQDEHTIKRTA